jgi:hypothetical protein
MVFLVGSLLPLVNLAATLFLTGLVWVLQVVQFPLMLRAGGLDFPNYVKEQRTRNTLLMAPAMLIEMATGVWLLFDDRVPHRDVFHAALLIAVIWIVTFATIVPIHSKLVRGFNDGLVRKLIRWNWIRTACWTLRSALLLWMVASPNAR